MDLAMLKRARKALDLLIEAHTPVTQPVVIVPDDGPADDVAEGTQAGQPTVPGKLRADFAGKL
jgi:hypothetical protein